MIKYGTIPISVLAGGRIFGLDSQLLFDLLFQGIAIFILFLFVGYLLINPVRKALKARQDKVKGDLENAEKASREAEMLKADYDDKLRGVNEEAETILSDARSKAKKNETSIINDAKEEAGRIIKNAEREAELEKAKAKDEVRKEIIGVASAMAGKFVAAEMDEETQERLLNDTLREIGEDTWQS